MNTRSQEMAAVPTSNGSLLQRMASRYEVDPKRMLTTLKATCFKGSVSDEQMVSLLIVADQYHLNPFTKEIYAFPSKDGGIVPVVGVDGWIRIINENPYFAGMEFRDGPYNEESFPQWIECTIHMTNRTKPMVIKEWFDECYRSTDAWNNTGRRMLRHRSMVQCARIAFGFVGIYEPSEAEVIAAAADITPVRNKPTTRAPRAIPIKQEQVPLEIDELAGGEPAPADEY